MERVIKWELGEKEKEQMSWMKGKHKLKTKKEEGKKKEKMTNNVVPSPLLVTANACRKEVIPSPNPPRAILLLQECVSYSLFSLVPRNLFPLKVTFL